MCALINRPEVFDLRPGSSFVEFLLGEGFDVFLVDWGVPDEEDADMGLGEFVCDELHWAVRETLLAEGEEELTLLGWVYRRHAVRDVLRAAPGPGGAQRSALVEGQIADQARAHDLPEDRALEEVILAPQAVKRLSSPRRCRPRSPFCTVPTGARSPAPR